MIKRAIWISVVFHLLILLSISRFVVQTGTNELKGVLVSHLSAPVRNVQQERGPGGESTKYGPTAERQSIQAAPKWGKESKNQVRKNSDFDRFFPSTVKSPLSSTKGASAESFLTTNDAQSMPTETLGLFRLTLARNARAYKEYPAIARENGWEGIVIVSVIYPLGLGAPLATLKQSSGHMMLDRQALELVERALAITTLPDTMQGKHFAVSLPIEYRLRD